MQASNVAGTIFGAFPDHDLEARLAEVVDLDLDPADHPPREAFTAADELEPPPWSLVKLKGLDEERDELMEFFAPKVEAPAPAPVPDDERPDENNPQRVPRFG